MIIFKYLSKITMIVILVLVSLLAFIWFNNPETETTRELPAINEIEDVKENLIEEQEEKEVSYIFTADEDKYEYYSPGSSKGYRYGPSIIRYDDGTMDMWVSRPGNSNDEWDYIGYSHYDGSKWSKEEVVLKPTHGTKDTCSVCDPGVVYFGGYYYLAYTSTSNKEMGGSDNSAFVARSLDPDGPFEKWNGESWGNEPEPFIEYEGNDEMWGIGEVSFVIYNEELYIYYTLADKVGNHTKLAKADLSENWPSTIKEIGTVIEKSSEDSYDVCFDEKSEMFLAFSVIDRMTPKSDIIVQKSKDGINFKEAGTISKDIPGNVHNMGISKDIGGHIISSEKQTIGYAYGENWGQWSMNLQDIKIDTEQ